MAQYPGEPTWMDIARRELGVKERVGPADNPRILQYLAATRIAPARHRDETPWCAAFVSWVLEQAGVNSTRSAAARSYAGWGRAMAEPRVGCIVVLYRGRRNGPHGHVGFYCGGDDRDLLLLGGNQRNSVSMRLFPRARAIAYRWPESP